MTVDIDDGRNSHSSADLMITCFLGLCLLFHSSFYFMKSYVGSSLFNLRTSSCLEGWWGAQWDEPRWTDRGAAHANNEFCFEYDLNESIFWTGCRRRRPLVRMLLVGLAVGSGNSTR